MKLSIEQANKLLSQLTAGVAVVANDAEADKNADLEQVFNNISEVVGKTIRPALEEEMKGPLESSFTGRYLGALRSAAQRVFNIPRREMEDMSIEQVLAKCKTALDGRYTQTDAERQTVWETTIQEYEQQIEQVKAEYETKLGEERDKYVQRDITSRCISLLEKLPRKGGDLQEQADMMRYKMQKVFEVRYNEDTKQLEFYKEGKQAIDENDQQLNDEDFARSWAERAGILVHDTRHISPAGVKAGQQQAYVLSLTGTDGEAPGDTMNAIKAWADNDA